MGFDSGKSAAKEARRQADAQKKQFEAEQTRMREANTLQANKALDDVVKVETGGSANLAADDALGLTTRKRKLADVSSSLGL
ncbi:virion protein [Vibrio phage vB_VpaP_AL-1]|nr:virion protein [Vibrio phage vB_VpaP_AL-1]